MFTSTQFPFPKKAPHPGDPDGKRYGLIATGIV